METANPEIVNQEFERKEFGHRAHKSSHNRWDGQLWGILQPLYLVISKFGQQAMGLLSINLKLK